MQSALKKIGNSSGIIIPKPLLAQMGARAGDAVDIAVEDGKLIIAKAKRKVREGWAEASELIGAQPLTEEDQDWLEFDDPIEGER